MMLRLCPYDFPKHVHADMMLLQVLFLLLSFSDINFADKGGNDLDIVHRSWI